MRFAIVIDKPESDDSADVPDLPGCVATGETVAEVKQEMHDLSRFRLDGMGEDGMTLPGSTAIVDHVDA